MSRSAEPAKTPCRPIALVLFLALCVPETVQSADWLWAQQAGGSQRDGGRSVAVDSAGNVYVTGVFGESNGNASFGAGNNAITLTNAGFNASFLAKLDASGTLLWAKRMGGTSSVEAFAIAVDKDANSFITGLVRGIASLGDGTSTVNITSMGDTETFLAKYDQAGKLLWAQSVRCSGPDRGEAVATDEAGNVYLAGTFEGVARFGGAAEEFFGSRGGQDVFIAKYDPTEALLWTQQAGGGYNDAPAGIAVNALGDVYVTGQFMFRAIFGGENSPVTVVGNSSFVPDVFVVRYRSDGSLIWVRAAGGTAYEYAHAVAADALGSVYVTGTFDGKTTFATENPGSTLTNAGGNDIFLLKYDRGGSFQWVKKAGGPGSDSGFALALDGVGNVRVGGSVANSPTFGEGDSAITFTDSDPYGDLFVAAYDPQGNFLWVRKAGGSKRVQPVNISTDTVYGLAIDGAGNTLITGESWSWPEFGSGAETIQLANSGHNDIFIAKLRALEPSGLPTILEPPASQTVVEGTNVLFHVLARGASPLRYQWRFNEASLSGATSGSLALTNVRPANAGRYDIVVSNSFGSATSQVAVLRVLVPPVITQWPTNQLMESGATVNLQTKAEGALPLSHQWFLNGAKILGATNATLWITNFQLANSGSYSVEVSNSDGSITSPETRIVLRKPGAKFWEFRANGPIYASPAIAPDGTVYVGTSGGDNTLYAFHPNGALKWSFVGNGSLDASPAIALDGTVYFGSSERKLFAFSPGGVKKWELTVAHEIHSSPALGTDGTIYVGDWSGKLYAVNADGTKKWEFAADFSIQTSPAISSDGSIYVGADSKLRAVNPDGSKKWEVPIPQGVFSSPALGVDGTTYVGANDNKLYAVGANGIKKWGFTTLGPIGYASPTIGRDGTIYVGSSDTNLYAIHPDGNRKWSFTTKGEIRASSAIAADGTIYFGSGDRKFYCLNSAGLEQWEFATEGLIDSSPAISPDGVVYFGSTDQKLYALVASTNLASSPWPMFQSDLRHTGQGMYLPTVRLLRPTDNSAFTTGETITLMAEASTPNGAIAQVEFYSDSNRIAAVASRPFTLAWGAAPAGVHFIRAQAVDELGANQTSSAIRIVVTAPNTPPSFLEDPQSQTTTNGANVMLSADAIGSPPLRFHWFKDGIPVPGVNASNLALTNVQVADSAHYALVVSNANGSVTSTPATVTVLQPVTLLWTSPALLRIRGGPAIGQGGRIYVPSESRNLTAFGPGGAFQWRFETGDYVWSSPALGTNGDIYFGSRDRNVYALSTNGTRLWNVTTGAAIDSSPAIGLDGTIYIGSNDKNLYALDPNGAQKWKFATGGEVASSPAIGKDGTIYVGSSDQNLYAVNPDGTKKWSYPVGRLFLNSPAIGAEGIIFLGNLDNKIVALNPDGTKRWEFRAAGPVYSSPAMGPDGTIYIGSDGVFDPLKGTLRGRLYALDPNGNEKWSFVTGEAVRSSPTIAADGTIYFGGNDNHFYALNPNGTVKWTVTADDDIESPPVIGFDGTVYFGSFDGKLYAVRESSSLATSSWPMFRRDSRHTGNALTPRQNQSWYFPFQSNAFDESVNAIAVLGNDLYVGGDFRVAGGVAADFIARWNGKNWSPLGAGLNAKVRALAVSGNDLFVAGDFTKAGTVSANRIARWDGTNWFALGDGSPELVWALAVQGTELFAGGGFTSVSGIAANHIAKWNGAKWSALGDGVNGFVLALGAGKNALYTGGPPLVLWDGVTWSRGQWYR